MSNIYSNYIDCVKAKKAGIFEEAMIEYPTVADGVDGVQFIEACLNSSENGNIWTEV